MPRFFQGSGSNTAGPAAAVSAAASATLDLDTAVKGAPKIRHSCRRTTSNPSTIPAASGACGGAFDFSQGQRVTTNTNTDNQKEKEAPTTNTDDSNRQRTSGVGCGEARVSRPIHRKPRKSALERLAYELGSKPTLPATRFQRGDVQVSFHIAGFHFMTFVMLAPIEWAQSKEGISAARLKLELEQHLAVKQQKLSVPCFNFSLTQEAEQVNWLTFVRVARGSEGQFMLDLRTDKVEKLTEKEANAQRELAEKGLAALDAKEKMKLECPSKWNGNTLVQAHPLVPTEAEGQGKNESVNAAVGNALDAPKNKIKPKGPKKKKGGHDEDEDSSDHDFVPDESEDSTSTASGGSTSASDFDDSDSDKSSTATQGPAKRLRATSHARQIGRKTIPAGVKTPCHGTGGSPAVVEETAVVEEPAVVQDQKKKQGKAGDKDERQIIGRKRKVVAAENATECAASAKSLESARGGPNPLAVGSQSTKSAGQQADTKTKELREIVFEKLEQFRKFQSSGAAAASSGAVAAATVVPLLQVPDCKPDMAEKFLEWMSTGVPAGRQLTPSLANLAIRLLGSQPTTQTHDDDKSAWIERVAKAARHFFIQKTGDRPSNPPVDFEHLANLLVFPEVLKLLDARA